MKNMSNSLSSNRQPFYKDINIKTDKSEKSLAIFPTTCEQNDSFSQSNLFESSINEESAPLVTHDPCASDNDFCRPMCYKCQQRGVPCPDDGWRKFCPLPTSGTKQNDFYQSPINLPVEYWFEVYKSQNNVRSDFKFKSSEMMTIVEFTNKSEISDPDLKHFQSNRNTDQVDSKLIKCQVECSSERHTINPVVKKEKESLVDANKDQNSSNISQNFEKPQITEYPTHKNTQVGINNANKSTVLQSNHEMQAITRSISTDSIYRPSIFAMNLTESVENVPSLTDISTWYQAICSKDKNTDPNASLESLHHTNILIPYNAHTNHINPTNNLTGNLSAFKTGFVGTSAISVPEIYPSDISSSRPVSDFNNNSTMKSNFEYRDQNKIVPISFLSSNKSSKNPKSSSKRHRNNTSSATSGKKRNVNILSFSNIGDLQAKDLSGCIMKISSSQNGSRKVQDLIAREIMEDNNIIFQEVLTCSLELMTDFFGNYVVQKLYEHCGQYSQIALLNNIVKANIIHLTLNEYGCRVVQAAFRNMALNSNQQYILDTLGNLEGSVLDCIQSKNGNHVIKLAIELVPSYASSVINAVGGHSIKLSNSLNSYTVLQVLIETMSDQCDSIVHELLGNPKKLVCSPLSNFIAQSIVSNGKVEQKSVLITWVIENLHSLCHQRHASNVVEMCILYSNPKQKQALVRKICQPVITTGKPYLEYLVDNHYGNYVVQTFLNDSIAKKYLNFAATVKQVIRQKELNGKQSIYLKGILNKLIDSNK